MEMVRDFVNEARELLDDAEPQIIEMEKTALGSGRVDEEILNAIFRLFHSLKGTASFLDFQAISSFPKMPLRMPLRQGMLLVSSQCRSLPLGPPRRRWG